MSEVTPAPDDEQPPESEAPAADSIYAYSSGGDEEDQPLNPFAAALREAEQKEEQEEEVDEVPETSTTDHAPAEDGPAEDGPAEDGPAEDGPAEDGPVEDASDEVAEVATTPEQEAAAEDADTDADAAPADETEEEEEEEPEPEPEISPYDMPGDWYVVHSYSGYENKVKANLMTRTQSMHMEDRIFEVVIPMEDVVEIKNGQRVSVPKKMFPGYILVRMYLDDDSWYAVRNTPGVTGFVGGGSKPTPLSRREVERFLGAPKPEEKKSPRFKPAWEIGETVRVVAGPFADFNGVIEDINVDQQKVTVLVSIFGRDTPMELAFEDIQKQ